MERRDFIRTAAIVGGALGVGQAAGLRHVEAESGISAAAEAGQSQQRASQLDPADRSPNRDPMEIHRSTVVVDGTNYVQTDILLEEVRKGGIDCVVRGGGMGSLQAASNVHNFLDENKNSFVLCRTVREIEEARRNGKVAFVFQNQQPQSLGARDGYPRPTPLRAHYEFGLRMLGLSYNVASIYAGGCLEPDIGLTAAGRRLVEEVHKLGIVLDVAGHVGEKASFEAIKIAPGVPVVSSHTNPRALCDNARNITDEMMKAIAKTGGVVQVCAFSDFHVRSRQDAAKRAITPQADLETHLDHYDYVRKLIGVDHVGIGSDHNLGVRDPASRDPVMQPLEVYSNHPSRFVPVKGYERPSELPNVTRGLIQRGWSTEDLRKLLGGNILRVFKQVWGA